MTVFQFDECSTSKSYLKSCKKSGLAAVRRYPTKHKGLPDPAMLEIYMAQEGVLVTYDHEIWVENEKHIPLTNPGIIIVSHSPAISYTLTQRSAANILDNFKGQFGEWHSVPWSNSLVTITDASVEVMRKSALGFETQLYRSLDQPGWQWELAERLKQNATALLAASNDPTSETVE